MATESIPLMARRCWNEYRIATKDTREAEEESLGFWAGGEKQWRAAEIASRRGNNRPWTTINRCKPAVDQVENQARSNPPGPESYPVGAGADKDGADILDGLIREYEYRSDATNVRLTGLRYAIAGGSGAYELATEYRQGRTMEQCLTLKEIPDPAMVFCDPNAMLRHRQDAMWQGKIQIFSEEQIKEQYPEAKLKIFNRSLIDRAAGWMQDAIGMQNNDRSTFAEWVNPTANRYYVCEFWRVTIEKRKMFLCTDNIIRYEDEMDTAPKGVTVKKDAQGDEMMRIDPQRKITKHVVTALDDLVDPVEWQGDIIPIFWLMGPEIYIKGKLYRLSLISGAIGPQRSLNYTATSMNEIVGLMTKSPFIGWEGQFDVTNAQGFNPWEASNTQVWAYMEVKPTWAINPTTKQAEMLPPPQRNTWEAPIARLFEALTFWGEMIKAATSIFFDPSTQNARDAESGEAIKALQAQTNIGTSGWQETLQSACTLEYQQAKTIFRKLYDGQRVVSIVKPDSSHEMAEINKEFPIGHVDPDTGKPPKTNNIISGEFGVRVTAGPSFKDRADKAIANIMQLIKAAPEIMSAPTVVSQIFRMLGEGNPLIDQIADSIDPAGGQEQTPAQLSGQVQQLTQKNQQLMQFAQQLHQAIEAKLPQVEADKWKAELDNLTKIRVAEITASKDADNAQADREAAMLEAMFNNAHEAATQATDHEHERGQAQMQAAQAQQSQQSDQDHQQQMAEQAQENEPAGASQ